jgi:hypothetical protein
LQQEADSDLRGLLSLPEIDLGGPKERSSPDDIPRFSEMFLGNSPVQMRYSTQTFFSVSSKANEGEAGESVLAITQGF